MNALLGFILAQSDGFREIGLLLAGLLLIGITVLVMKLIEKTKRAAMEKELAAARTAAEAEAQKIIAQAEAKAKTEFINRRDQFDKETEQARRELREEEKRVSKREDLTDRKLETLNAKERQLTANAEALAEREKSLAAKDHQLSELIEKQNAELLKIAELTKEDAKQMVLQQVEKDIEREAGELIERRLQDAQETSEAQSRGNIRAFEKATGVDVIVDDTPGVVVVSAFDPVRREVARRSLEKLIQDGRIHPTRIEEVVAAIELEVNKQIYEVGKEAMVEAKIRGLHNKLIHLLGRLHFRTSYGQNVLKHSAEVAYLAQVISDELGLSGRRARRAGLLHDIGKAVDHEVEGGHPQIGADLCKRYGEKPEIVNAVAGHHGDIEATSIYTPIIMAADAISASRPGARRESLERYIERLQALEGIATSFEGVKQAYAIQAGREVRVIVDADNVDDRLSAKIAHDIARRVEDEMEYPGEVKVTLVREVRCVEYAR